MLTPTEGENKKMMSSVCLLERRVKVCMHIQSAPFSSLLLLHMEFSVIFRTTHLCVLFVGAFVCQCVHSLTIMTLQMECNHRIFWRFATQYSIDHSKRKAGKLLFDFYMSAKILPLVSLSLSPSIPLVPLCECVWVWVLSHL